MNAKIILNNQFIDSAKSEVMQINSILDNSQLGQIECATGEQAVESIVSAQNAFESWKYTNLSERIEILKKASVLLKGKVDLLSNLLSHEIGKSPEDAKSEIARSIEYLDMTIDAVKFVNGKVYYGDVYNKYPRNRKTGFYSRIPLGVILAISPFNYPINLSITKIAPALVTGNTVVFKPAFNGSLTAFEFYKTFIEAGLPQGVLNFVTGKSSEIGDVLISHKSIALIAFTGSTDVGNHIKQISNGIPLLLELGGKDNAIVSNNADLDLATNEIVSGAFSYSGQRCTAQKLVLVYKDVAETLKQKIQDKMSSLNLGPMLNSEAVDYVLELIKDAEDKGAQVVVRGSRSGNVLSPTLLYGVTPEMRIFFEEQFGPVLPISLVENEADALSKANMSKFGLQASVYTENIEEAYRLADKLEVGSVQINGKGDRGPDNFPFGGVKDSGSMMQGLTESLELMTRGKLIVLNLHKTN